MKNKDAKNAAGLEDVSHHCEYLVEPGPLNFSTTNIDLWQVKLAI